MIPLHKFVKITQFDRLHFICSWYILEAFEVKCITSERVGLCWAWQAVRWRSIGKWLTHEEFAERLFKGLCSFKGVVHPPKNVIIYSPSTQVGPNLYECLCSAEYRRIYYEESFVIRLFWGTIDFHSRRKKILLKSMVPRTALFPTFFRISPSVFKKNKDIHTGLGWVNDRISFLGELFL